MAWCLWNKIKKGFKKVGRVLKRGVEWVNNKIVKTFKPAIVSALNAYKPGAGAIVEAGSAAADMVTNGDIKGAVNGIASWAKKNLK